MVSTCTADLQIFNKISIFSCYKSHKLKIIKTAFGTFKMKKLNLWTGIIISFFIVFSIIYFLKPEKSDEHLQNKSAINLENPARQNTLDHTQKNLAIFASASQQDTQINCQLTLNNNNELITNEQTKNCFEYFITQYGEKKTDQIKDDFKTYISQQYTDPARSQILDLWNRYFEYRLKLGEQQAPAGVTSTDPQYFRALFTSLNTLRQTFFSYQEIKGLFGAEDIYHNYTLDRMDIFANQDLNEAEKAEKLKELFNKLPIDWQNNLEQLYKLEDLQKLTSDIKAKGGNANDIRNMRLNLVGPEATQRLENLDSQQNNWKNNVNNYLEKRHQILNSSLSKEAKNQSIQKLKEQNFTTSQEQLRLETFEKLYDKGTPLPFAE